MAKTIWKFHVPVTDQFVLHMPFGAEFLSVQTQRGEPESWWLVEPDAPREARQFRVHGTGHDVPPATHGRSLVHLGTFQMQGEFLVFHLFEEAAS